MAKKWSFVVGVGVLLSMVAVWFAEAYGGGYDVVDPVIREDRIAALRERGQAGLNEALAAYDQLETRIAVAESNLTAAMGLLNDVDSTAERRAIAAERRLELDRLLAQKTQLRSAIDQVGGQRSCTVSRLFWHTDLAKAEAEAKRTGRPILSLRMLGKLTDEYSCANSRFFRTSLYSNQEISQFLRDNFVLHWQSVRPVPRVTIDFGDGRKLERTLTGNSAHYVLTSDGTPLGALPGLYSPQAFRQWSWKLASFYSKYKRAPAAERTAMLQAFHQSEEAGSLRSWDFDIQRLGTQQADLVATRITGAIYSARLAGQPAPAAGPAPKAVAAAQRAVGKTAVEAPLLRFANLGGQWMEAGMDDDLWQAIANLHREEATLDQASVALMRAEFPNAAQAGALAMSKRRAEDPILRVVRQFENSIALDTVRNEYLLHRRIHEQFAAGDAVTADVDTLNEWVYAELFLTPSSDPWLGLAPPDVYTALDGGGQVVATAGAPAGRE